VVETVQQSPVRDIRRAHRRQVLTSLRDDGPQPRIELARRLHLSATTITKVIAQLIDEGVVREGEAGMSVNRVGRPSTDVHIETSARFVVGVQVGSGSVHAGLCDLFGRIQQNSRARLPTGRQSAARVLPKVAEVVQKLFRDSGVRRDKLLGIGVAAPGPVDVERRRNVLAINLGWQDVPFSDYLEDEFGLPTVVDHNVRAMATAEAHFRQHPDGDTLLFVYVRTGVGAGAVIDGVPFRPGPYGVTELGHLQVVEKGRLCACGANGCLETVASEPYLLEQLKLIGRPRGPALPGLMSAVALGDPQAKKVLDDLIDHLSTGLASAVNLLNPRLILLGGMFEDAPEDLVERLRADLTTKAFPALHGTFRVEVSGLGPHAGVIGGAAVALDTFFYG